MGKKITNHGAFKTYQGAHKSIQVNILNYLPQDRYILALNRLRAAIAAGRRLEADNDDSPGDKSMGCSWGLCDDNARTWPDPQDHIFPVDFLVHGRTSPLDTQKHLCPMDRRDTATLNGCFYTCRIFQANKQQPAPTRTEALKLYDDMLAKQAKKEN